MQSARTPHHMQLIVCTNIDCILIYMYLYKYIYTYLLSQVVGLLLNSKGLTADPLHWWHQWDLLDLQLHTSQ